GGNQDLRHVVGLLGACQDGHDGSIVAGGAPVPSASPESSGPRYVRRLKRKAMAPRATIARATAPMRSGAGPPGAGGGVTCTATALGEADAASDGVVVGEAVAVGAGVVGAAVGSSVGATVGGAVDAVHEGVDAAVVSECPGAAEGEGARTCSGDHPGVPRAGVRG